MHRLHAPARPAQPHATVPFGSARLSNPDPLAPLLATLNSEPQRLPEVASASPPATVREVAQMAAERRGFALCLDCMTEVGPEWLRCWKCRGRHAPLRDFARPWCSRFAWHR